MHKSAACILHMYTHQFFSVIHKIGMGTVFVWYDTRSGALHFGLAPYAFCWHFLVDSLYFVLQLALAT